MAGAVGRQSAACRNWQQSVIVDTVIREPYGEPIKRTHKFTY